MPHHRTRHLVFVALILWGVGCSTSQDGDAPKPSNPAAPGEGGVPAEVSVGQALHFPCKDPDIMPPLGSLPGSSAKVVRKPGKYTWQCSDQEVGTFTALPGEAVGVAWSPELQKAVVLGRSVQLRAWTTDSEGHEVAPLTLRASPPEAVVVEGERLRFIGAGLVKVEALDPSGKAVGEQTIRVDAGPPVVRVLTPKRGEIVSSSTQDWVIIQGHVEEDGPVVHLTVNGQVVVPDRNGVFEFSMKPERAGLQVLTYRASDELSQLTTGSHAVLFGQVRNVGQRLSTAARVYLPAAVLDDDDPALDDLARAAEMMLSGLVIPNTSLPIGCGGRIHLSDIKWKPAQIDLKPLPQQLLFRVDLRDLSVKVSGNACLCAWGSSMGCASLDGAVSTPLISTSTRLAVGKPSPTSVELVDINIDISPLSIHWNIWSGSLDWFVELFEASIREYLTDTVKSTLSARLRSDLAALLDHILPSQYIELPPPFSTAIAVKTHLENLSASAQGLRLDFGFSVETPTGPLTLKVSTFPPPLPPDQLGIALSLDIINEALYSLYQRGALSNVTLDWKTLNLQPPPGLGTVKLTASLPPILMPGKNPGELELSVGDLKIEAQTPLGTIDVFVSFIMSVRLQYDPASASIVLTLLSDNFELHFAPASKDDALTLSASLLDLETVARDGIIQTLSMRQLRFAVPVIDLSKIKSIPAFKGQRIGLKDADLSVSPSGYITLTTHVENQPSP